MIKVQGIYKLTSPSNKIYIGQSINLYKRLNCHKNNSTKSKSAIQKCICKYGWENMIVEILWSSETCDGLKNTLNQLEEKYIIDFNSIAPKGYNLQTGGNSKLPSEESKKKMSDQHKGKFPSTETKLKMSETQKKKIFSKETKLKLSVKAKGKTVSQETKLKMQSNAQNMWANNRQKIIKAQKERKHLTCPHCSRTMAPSNAKQWHFDNCKLKQI